MLCSALVVMLATSMPLGDPLPGHAAQSADRPAGNAGELTLDVLTWNVQLRPWVPEGKRWRTPLMAEHMRGYDVILLQEAFSDAHRNLLVHSLADDYPYRTRVLGRDGWFSEDGGVVILSRWPIEDERQLSFGGICAGSDCLAEKGALYARVNKYGRRVHLVATHLQSGPARDVREQQMARIRDWIGELGLPADEPVLIGGDLNTDRLSDDVTGAFSRMLDLLRAVHPAAAVGRHQPTYDPLRNPLSRGSTGRYVDYLLYSTEHRRPLLAHNEVVRIAADGRPLSDHFAVRGRFAFGPPSPAAAPRPLAAPPASS